MGGVKYTSEQIKKAGLIQVNGGPFVKSDKLVSKKKLTPLSFELNPYDRILDVKESTPDVSKYKGIRSGKITIGDRTIFVRSSWEANIAAYLEFKKVNRLILDWEYESITFWFDGIKRGVCSYKPDFTITELDGSKTYIEVKGHMDSKSKTKLKRMKKYHPAIKIELIDKARYTEIKKLKNLIPYWGQLDKK